MLINLIINLICIIVQKKFFALYEWNYSNFFFLFFFFFVIIALLIEWWKILTYHILRQYSKMIIKIWFFIHKMSYFHSNVVFCSRVQIEIFQSCLFFKWIMCISKHVLLDCHVFLTFQKGREIATLTQTRNHTKTLESSDQNFPKRRWTLRLRLGNNGRKIRICIL